MGLPIKKIAKGLIGLFVNLDKPAGLTNATTVVGAGIGATAYLTLLQSDDIYMQACGFAGIALGFVISVVNSRDK